MLIDRHRRVLAGHGRILACQELGWRKVPTISLAHLTDTQARAFMIADNRLTENSTWDERLLGEQLKGLAEVHLEFRLDATGFEVGEIDLLIEGVLPAPEGAGDPVDHIPDLPAKPPVSQLGDLWLLGRHRVYCGSALEEKAYHTLMEQTQAAMVFTDPPYNVPIEGHASGLGRVMHENFVMASGELSEAEFIAFLTQACRLVAQASVEGALVTCAWTGAICENSSPRAGQRPSHSKISVSGIKKLGAWARCIVPNMNSCWSLSTAPSPIRTMCNSGSTAGIGQTCGDTPGGIPSPEPKTKATCSPSIPP
jgi:hypothetical protein